MNPFTSAVSTAAKASVYGGIGGLRTAGTVANLGFHAGARTLRAMGGGRIVEMAPGPFGKTKIPMFTKQLQNSAVGAVALGGVAVGAYRQQMGPKWSLNSGMEIERDDMLGATGSMALSLGRKGERSGYNPFSTQQMAISYADDVARLLLP
jgi:hypothetical protein